MDRRIGLIDRLAGAIVDSHHPSYITHPMQDLLTQRVFQIASGYEDGNDANTLRRDLLFKLAAGRAPLNPDNPLACGATVSRLEGSLRRSDIYRMARALVIQFIASYAHAPSTITLDLDHTDDATYGQTSPFILQTPLRPPLLPSHQDARHAGFPMNRPFRPRDGATHHCLHQLLASPVRGVGVVSLKEQKNQLAGVVGTMRRIYAKSRLSVC